jgi:peroxiredoxin
VRFAFFILHFSFFIDMLHPTLLPGMPAPRFTLPNQRGELKALSDYLLLGPVLLAFHRGTW